MDIALKVNQAAREQSRAEFDSRVGEQGSDVLSLYHCAVLYISYRTVPYRTGHGVYSPHGTAQETSKQNVESGVEHVPPGPRGQVNTSPPAPPGYLLTGGVR